MIKINTYTIFFLVLPLTAGSCFKADLVVTSLNKGPSTQSSTLPTSNAATAVQMEDFQLDFTLQPPIAITAGNAFSVHVTILDASGDPFPIGEIPITLRLRDNPTGDSMRPFSEVTQSTNDDGATTFSGLSLVKAGSNYTLEASSPEIDSAVSLSFTILSSIPSKLDFKDQPTEVTSNSPFDLTVEIQDAYGNVVSDPNFDVTLSMPQTPNISFSVVPDSITSIGGQALFSTPTFQNTGTSPVSASLHAIGSHASFPNGIQGTSEPILVSINPPPMRTIWDTPENEEILLNSCQKMTFWFRKTSDNTVVGLPDMGYFDLSTSTLSLSPHPTIKMYSNSTCTSLLANPFAFSLARGTKSYSFYIKTLLPSGTPPSFPQNFRINLTKTNPATLSLETRNHEISVRHIQVSAGYRHTCAIVDGMTYCWGNGQKGALGLGTSSDSYSPQLVAGLSGSKALALSAGFETSCALLDTGRLKCWGSNEYGLLGSNSAPQSNPQILAPAADANAGFVQLPATYPLTSVSLGYHSACAVYNQEVYCWGKNKTDLFGTGKGGVPESWTPILITGFASGELIQDVSLFGANDSATACALLATGKIKCWGSNASGELGSGSNPLLIPSKTIPEFVKYKYNYYLSGKLYSAFQDLTGVSLLSLGGGLFSDPGKNGGHGCAFASGSTLRCWGRNDKYQLKGKQWNPVNLYTDYAINTYYSSLTKAITTGAKHSCALIGSGVKCWGDNEKFQIGNNTNTLPKTPSSVSGLTSNVMGLSKGSSTANHTCAIVKTEVAGNSKLEIYCWGDNQYGQLGIGDTAVYRIPQKVTLPGTGP